MADPLILQLVLATVSVIATVLVHLAGLAGLLVLLRMHRRRFTSGRGLFDQAAILVGAAFGLFALHAAEIWGYAVLYRLLGAFTTFEQSLYFSTATYSTVGYGDLVLPMDWRILGAVEGVNGLILLGWSTAFFVSVVNRIRILEHDWLD
jgi:voltage-gated potassium channel